MAACSNVETYAAAQVFYWVGYNGISYVLDVFIADTSRLENRALMFAFSTSPYIATTFAGPAAAQSFLRTSGWRWGYGVFAIITPAICLPFVFVFWYNQRLAKKQGVLPEQRKASGRTWLQSLRHYLIEFDGKSARTLFNLRALLTDKQSLGSFSSSLASRCFCYHSAWRPLHPRNGSQAQS